MFILQQILLAKFYLRTSLPTVVIFFIFYHSEGEMTKEEKKVDDENKRIKGKEELHKLMIMALAMNRKDFVKLFLDYGISLREVLTKEVNIGCGYPEGPSLRLICYPKGPLKYIVFKADVIGVSITYRNVVFMIFGLLQRSK